MSKNERSTSIAEIEDIETRDYFQISMSLKKHGPCVQVPDGEVVRVGDVIRFSDGVGHALGADGLFADRYTAGAIAETFGAKVWRKIQ